MLRIPKSVADASHAVLRIGAGLFFVLHGGQKLFGWFGGMGPQGGTAELASLMGVAGVLETVGGTLILIGLFTMPIAFLLSGQMAVAYFMMHFPKGLWPIQNMGEPAALFSLIFLFLAFNGAGPASVDAWLSNRRAARKVDLPREYELPTTEVTPERRRRAG